MRSSRKTRVFISISRTIYRSEGEGGAILNSFFFSCENDKITREKRWLFFLLFSNWTACAPARISWHEAGNLMPHFLASHRILQRRRSHPTESSNQTIANDRQTIARDLLAEIAFALQPRTVYDRIGVYTWLIRVEAGMHRSSRYMNSSLSHHDKLMIVVLHSDLLNNFICILYNFIKFFCRRWQLLQKRPNVSG